MWEPVRLTWPYVSGRADTGAVHSSLTRLIASGAAESRVALVRATGLSRTSVNTHLDQLLAAGVVVESGRTEVTGRGRPAHRLSLASRPGVVLVADVGAHSARLAVTDLGQTLLAYRQVAFDVRRGPENGLDILSGYLGELLDEAALSPKEVRSLSIGLPGPVDARMGRPVRPPIMPGWDNFPVGDWLGKRFSCPVLVDNDVNLMALGEARSLPSEASPLLFIKIGTGIGGGLVTDDGQLHGGADGAAGDIGHVRVPNADDIVCECGNVGCVEAVASAAAVLRQLRRHHPDLHTVEDLAAKLRSGDASAVRAIRAAAEPIGELVATLVHFYNPRTVVLGGLVSTASDDLLAGIRGVVYRRALPLATRNLSLTHSRLGQFAGLAGGAVVGIERILSPAHVGELVAPPRAG